MPRQLMSALEPLFVLGIVTSLAMVGVPSLSTLISRKSPQLVSVLQNPDESTPVALADDELQSLKNH